MTRIQAWLLLGLTALLLLGVGMLLAVCQDTYLRAILVGAWIYPLGFWLYRSLSRLTRVEDK